MARGAVVKRNYPMTPRSNPRPSTSVLSSAVGALAGMNPYTNAAYNVGRIARRLYKSRQQGTQTQTAEKEAATFSGTGYRGYFTRRRKRKMGKYRKLKRRRRMRKMKLLKKPSFNKCLKYGAIATLECVGQVNDPNCVYLGHQAVSANSIIDLIARSVIKKLWAQAGFQITNFTTQLATMSGNFDILINITDENGNSVASTNFKSGTDTPLTMSAWLQLRLVEYAAGFGLDNASNLIQFHTINLSFPTFYAAPSVGQPLSDYIPYRAMLRFDQLTMNMVCMSELRVQNRSKNIDGSSSTEVVNVNALIGKIYDFSTGPKSVVQGYGDLEIFDFATGINLRRAAEFPQRAQAREPPMGRMFNNCKKTDKIVLQPGEIKTGKIYYTKTLKVLSFLKTIEIEAYTIPSNSQKVVKHLRVPGQFIVLEDVINFNANEKITVAYELNRKVGCYLTYKKPLVSVSSYNSTSLSNLTPILPP